MPTLQPVNHRYYTLDPGGVKPRAKISRIAQVVDRRLFVRVADTRSDVDEDGAPVVVEIIQRPHVLEIVGEIHLGRAVYILEQVVRCVNLRIAFRFPAIHLGKQVFCLGLGSGCDQRQAHENH